jgi:hypothetical protein
VPVGFRNIFGAVIDHRFEALVGEDWASEFRKVLLGKGDDSRIDLHLSQPLHPPMFEDLFGNATIAAADDEHVLGFAMGKQWHMRHHLLVDELVLLGNLRRAVQHEHLAEEAVLEQHQVLMLGLQFVEYLLDFKGHAKAEIVEQRLRNPALLQ